MKQIIGNVLFGVGALMMISMAPVVFSGRDFSFLPIILAAALAAVGSFLREDSAATSKGGTPPSRDQSDRVAEDEYDEALRKAREGDFATAASHAEMALRVNPNYDLAQDLRRMLVDLKRGLVFQDAAKDLFTDLSAAPKICG